MNLVKISTRLLELVTKKSLARAEKRNQKNIGRVKAAKEDAAKSAFELQAKAAETLIQLTKVQNLSKEIGERQAIQVGKVEKINALLEQIDD